MDNGRIIVQEETVLSTMAALDALDCEIGGIPSNAAAVFGSIAMNGDEYVRCNHCGFGGCDIRVAGCGCTMHAVSDLLRRGMKERPCDWSCGMYCFRRSGQKLLLCISLFDNSVRGGLRSPSETVIIG